MTKSSTKDISIGENSAIDWIEPVDQDNAFAIDELLYATLPFWKSMETECEAECCGIQAFNLHDVGVAQAVAESDDDGVVNRLIELRQVIDDLAQQTLVSTLLNNYFDRAVFLQLVDHLIGSARSAQGRLDS